jgi:small subunit ribosomal protein S2
MATKAAKVEEVKTPKIKKLKTQKVELSAKKAAAPKKVAAKEPKTVKAKAVKKTVKVVEAGVPETDVKVKEVKVEKKKPGSVLEELFEAGAHFGHVVKKWNPKMKRFIWGAKNGIHIFDLEKTMAGLESATKILTELSASGKRVILVGTKRQVRQMIEVEARRLDIPFISQRWIGGLITNWKQVKQTVDRLNSQKLLRESGQLKKYTKKEQVMFDKEIARLERNIGGIAALKEAPEVVVVFDTHKEKLAVKEASSRGITVVGIVDSNANPDLVDYPIPMNDDSAKGLEIVVRTLGQAIETGLKKTQELKESRTQDSKK